MARTARLTTRFLARRVSLGVVTGSRTSKTVGAVIASLARALVLPGPADFEAAMPPVRSAFVRRVPDENLWIWYRFDEESVTLINITQTPPVPTA